MGVKKQAKTKAKRAKKTKQPERVTCPHCAGDGEEPGAPVEPDGVWLCVLCGGMGLVTEAAAQRWTEE